MMNMEVMRQLVAEAELGAKSMPTAYRALSHWAFDPGTLKHLRYSATAVYAFRQEGVLRILRLNHAGDRARDHVQAELDFVRYLAAQGIRAMQPLLSQAGEEVVTVESPYARFYAAAFEYAPGEQLDEPEALDDDRLAAWGRLMAKIHKAAEGYSPPAHCRRPDWQEVVEWVAAWLPPDELAAWRTLDQAVGWLSGLPAAAEDYGLIHWDLCVDNLAWEGDRCSVFDFDDAAYFWYAADLAFALEGLATEPSEPRGRVLTAFLSGYRAVRPAIEPWLDMLPRFVKFMGVFKFARVLRALAFADPALDPAWMGRLRAKLTRYLEERRAAFVEPL